MQNVILSADGEAAVYAVPDAIAADLKSHCRRFSDEWVRSGPEADRFRLHNVACFTEVDFIDYLNRWVFRDEPSVLVEKIGWIEDGGHIPEKYRGCPRHNF